jgi:hypothetical protein
MGGCDNPRMGKDISDLCGWLENMDEYPLKSAMGFVSKMVDISGGWGGGSDSVPPPTVSFPHENIYLPFSFEDSGSATLLTCTEFTIDATTENRLDRTGDRCKKTSTPPLYREQFWNDKL